MSAEKFERYMRESKNVLRIAGSASFETDIETDFVIASGSIKSTGMIRAKVLKIAGSASLRGINAEEISYAGFSIVQGDIAGNSVRIAGSVRAEAIKCRELNAAGSISASSIEAEKAVIKFSDGTVKSIKADIVRIYPERGFLFRWSRWADAIILLPPERRFLFRRTFSAGRIVGKEVSLTRVRCDEVDADNAFIGDDCEIGVLRCKNAEISRKARVREVVRGDSGGGAGQDI